MKTCGTCKHWSKGFHAAFTDPPGEWIEYELHWMCFTEEQDLGLCGREGGDKQSGPLFAATCEGEGIYGELVTDARFGCILHEAVDG